MTMKLLIAAGTAVTNPSPNSLPTIDPFGTSTGLLTPQSAWTIQQNNTPFYAPCLCAKDVPLGNTKPACRLDFSPSGGGGTTYVVTVYRFNRISKVWYVPYGTGSFTFTGNATLPIENLDNDPWFIQLSTISTGTIRIDYDTAVMVAF